MLTRKPAAGLIEVVLQSKGRRRGMLLPEAGLWLDPPFPVKRAFVSHAHSDHVGRHEVTLCTELTQRLMQGRMGLAAGRQFITPPLREPLVLENHELRLLPAGHVIGSSMLHITRLRDGATLLYTGDFKLRQGLTTERAELLAADTLIMETTFGLPRYRFPPTDEIVTSMRRFVDESIAEGRLPVLLGYSLGKAQEILAALRDAPHPVMAHESILKVNQLAGGQLPPMPMLAPLNPSLAGGHIIVMPPHLVKTSGLSQNHRIRTAMISGWGLDPSAKYRYGVDEVFPLSDHADHPELLRAVELVDPRLTLTVHGHTREFAAELRRSGRDARALGQVEQLELPI